MTAPAKEPAPNSFEAIDANRSAPPAHALLARAVRAICTIVTVSARKMTVSARAFSFCLAKSTNWVFGAVQFLALKLHNRFMISDIVRQNLAIALAEKGLTQAALAERVGKSVSTITKWLNGDRPISLEDLGGIADAVGWHAGRFFVSPHYSLRDLEADQALVAISNALHKKDKNEG